MSFRFEKAAKQAWIVVENNAQGGDGWVRIDSGEERSDCEDSRKA